MIQMNVGRIYPDQNHGKVQIIIAGMVDGSIIKCRNSLLTPKRCRVQVDTHVFSGKWGNEDVLYWVSKNVANAPNSKCGVILTNTIEKPCNLPETNIDITAQKNIGNEFTEYGDKYRRLIETTMISIGDGVISTDTGGKVVFLNREAERLTGWTQEEPPIASLDTSFGVRYSR